MPDFLSRPLGQVTVVRRRRRLTAALLSAGLLTFAAGCGSGSDTATSSSAGPSASQNGRGPGGGPGGGGPGGGNGGDTPPACTPSSAAPTAAPAAAVPAFNDTTVVSGAVTTAQAFLATLTAEQKKAVLYSFSDLGKKQCSWSNYPDDNFKGRLGVRLGDLSAAQKTAALAALQSVLSPAGYAQVLNEMHADDVLGQNETQYGEANYHIVLYGNPSADKPWTLQFGGHHVAVHVSLGGDVISVSPHFSGTQPVSFDLDGKTVRPLGEESDTVFPLVKSLTADQQTAAQLSGKFNDLVMGPSTDTGYPKQEGLSYTKLTAAQQTQVKNLIKDYVSDAATAISDPILNLYTSQLDQTTISYSGTVTADSDNGYFRIDGPRVWIEWLNTGASGLHYHTLYRDKQLDYGTGLS
ncbi:hypothetical protein GCM10010435_60390 [Winogradskya consettensis]|uniref:DUF3500 domain-containing protein n=1 Tax=Winogradskya consettensis TaxID=113560 RepID=A0A919VRT0_9ACTN|nr:DUF3500 domain-containing protein [Actinoplanes consettensis]GIM76389.1 hypothetical protein Aco04nite_50170 [Actinoplanes consettensis]